MYIILKTKDDVIPMVLEWKVAKKKGGYCLAIPPFISAPGIRMNYRVQVPNLEDRSRG